MFAALTFDREPLALSWDTFVTSLNSWTQIAGGFAMLGLVIWLIAYLASRGGPEGGNPVVRLLSGNSLGVLATVLLGPFGALLVYLSLVRRKALGADEQRGALTTVLF